MKSPEQKLAALCATFPALAGMEGTGTDGAPWSPELLLARYGTASSGERACIKFVLEVYNPECLADIGRFDLDDLARMDPTHQHIFAEWAVSPWWA